MRILRIHNRYQLRGGEDAVYEAEAAILERYGHNVLRLEFSNGEISSEPSLVGALKLAGNTIWSISARRRIADAVDQFEPDLVHFDNTFPLVSPAAYGIVKARGVPVVQTLHNYRLLCPSALLYHDGKIYEHSIGHLVPFRAVMDGVYRGSRSQTAVVAAMLAAHRLLGTWNSKVDRFVVLTEFARNKFIQGGLPADKLVVKPNFANSGSSQPLKRSEQFLFVGRLSEEKGIGTLMNAQPIHRKPMRVAGDGPMVKEVESVKFKGTGLVILGRINQAEVQREMTTAFALVVPSESYETFGLAAVEAFSAGTPVIASRLGSMSEIIQDGVTGLHFEAGNAADLAAKITWAAEHPEEMRRMGENARREYEAKYTPERNYEMLMDIYVQAIEHAASRRS